MTAVIAAAIFAVKAVGGMDTLVTTLNARPGPHGLNYFNILPDFHSNWEWLLLFFMSLAVQWWAVWYPGSEPGGGSYIAQRMLA